MRTFQEHAHDAAPHGHGTMEEWLLFAAGLIAVAAMVYVYLRHIRPRRKAK